jgi:hypothetical protein
MGPQGRALPLLPSRPLAGRVGRVSEANADGVGGLRLLRAYNEAKDACSLLVAPPTPDPSPPLASLAGGGERRQLA